MDRDVKRINDTAIALFGTVTKMEEEAVRKSSGAELSVTEVHTLAAIGTGRPRTMTHVANILGIKVSTLTTAVGRLVRKGYVGRSSDEKDRRIVKLSLTEKGRLAVREHEAFHEAVAGDAIAQIPQENLSAFISSLEKISSFMTMRSSMPYEKGTEFELRPLKLAGHTLPVPIVSAGMSIGVAGKRLASAVAVQGGLGLIGTSCIGYRSEGYDKDPLGSDLRVLEAETAEACRMVKEAGGSGLIGAAVMWNDRDAGEYVRAAVRGGAQVIVTSAGLPKDLPKYCTDRKVALLPTISSRRAAAAITRTWTQKYNRTPDGFIYQGPAAAGLLGFRESELERACSDNFKIIAEIKAELAKLENCPLIVGGGIFDKSDAENVFRYGADGILMGTRFIATEECDAGEEYKRLYLNCTENDVTIVRSPMKTSARVMKNTFADMLAGTGKEDYDIIRAVLRGIEGDRDGGLIFCSANAGRISRTDTVGDVFREFTT